jgi:hypothetical protein
LIFSGQKSFNAALLEGDHMKRLLAAAAALATFSAFAAPPQDTPAGEQRFRELYK